MSESDAGIGPLMDAVIDGSSTESERREFADKLRTDPVARASYINQMQTHAILQWRYGRVGASSPTAAAAPRLARERRRLFRSPSRLAASAVLMLALGAGALAWRFSHRGAATLVEVNDMVWGRGRRPIAVGERVFAGSIGFESGSLRLTFNSGASLFVEGPADLEVVSEMRMRATRGRFTAHAGGSARGFSLETHNVQVVDRGTEFGLAVDPSTGSDVVVFEGEVELVRRGPSGRLDPVGELIRGEATHVGPDGELGRIFAVERRRGDERWTTTPSTDGEALIRSVRDDGRIQERAKCFQIIRGGLVDDAPAYVDRAHEWNGLDRDGLPAFLRGADYIKTFNDDKSSRNFKMTVEIGRPASLYVFFDDRMKPPSWLTRRFVDTGADLGLDEEDTFAGRTAPQTPSEGGPKIEKGPGRSVDNVFSVWKRDASAGETVELGALPGEGSMRAMYGVAAVPRR